MFSTTIPSSFSSVTSSFSAPSYIRSPLHLLLPLLPLLPLPISFSPSSSPFALSGSFLSFCWLIWLLCSPSFLPFLLYLCLTSFIPFLCIVFPFLYSFPSLYSPPVAVLSFLCFNSPFSFLCTSSSSVPSPSSPSSPSTALSFHSFFCSLSFLFPICYFSFLSSSAHSSSFTSSSSSPSSPPSTPKHD